MFLLLNVLRMHVQWRKDSLPTVKQLVESLRGDAPDRWRDGELPSYLTTPSADLSEEDQKQLRQRFHQGCNMTTFSLHRWLNDPRQKDGCGVRRHDLLRTRQLIRELIFLKATALRSGHGWSPHFYALAQECVFVYEHLFHQRRVDYQIWAILKNFGLDWERPVGSVTRRRLPKTVQRDAQAALAKYQISGKRRRA
jgi:hypothetical protein